MIFKPLSDFGGDTTMHWIDYPIQVEVGLWRTHLGMP